MPNVHLLMVNTPSNFTRPQPKPISAFLVLLKMLPFDNVLCDISIMTKVSRKVSLIFLKKLMPILIGISTHGRQGIAHFFNGSISEDLVNHANRPVITFKI